VQESFDATTYATSVNGTPIVNQLSSADMNLYEGRGDNSVVYLTRNNWEGTFPKQIVQFKLTEQMIGELQDLQYDPADYASVSMPTMGAKNGMKLYDMIGKDFNDPAWQPLLDQLTFDEMVSMIGDSFHWRMPAESVHAPGSRDENGPQGLTAALFGAGLGDVKPTAFTSEDVMAATFNVELMYEVGNMIGNNCLAADVGCLYGPGANIHRTPYGGRNFEYYSEDGFLSGEIGGAEVKGIQDKGVDVVMKHFALNDCEQERIGQAAWLTEQAAREIYLKAFQKSLEESGGNGIMTAYTRWGTRWSGSYKGLMTGIMRGEWGNMGMSITDNVLTTYTNGVDAILAGGVTTHDAMLWYVTEQLPKFEDDPVVVTAMREACHHNLYAIANSSVMNGVGANTTVKAVELTLIVVLRVVTVIMILVCIPMIVMWILGKRKWKQTEEYKAYRAYKAEHKKKK
jgi:beta-glucosidase